MTAARPKGSSTLVSIVAMLLFGVFRRFLGLISIATLGRLLTPAEVGAYAFTQSTGQTFVGLFRLGALQGLHVSTARRLSARDKGDIDELLGCGLLLICGIATVGSVVMIALADPIARDLFGEPDLAPYVTVAAVFFAGQFLSQGVYVGYAGLDRFVEYTYYATATGIFTVFATILFAVLFGVQGAVWAFAATTLASVPVFFVGLLRIMRPAGLRFWLRMRRDHLREVFAIGLPFYGAGLFMIPAEFVAMGMVSRSGGVEDLADLRVILALMALVQLIPQAISGPIISLLSEREGQLAGSGISSALDHMRFLWIFGLVSGAALAFVWPAAVVLVFGAGFPQALAMGQMAIIAFIPTIVGTSLSAGLLVGGRSLPLLFVGFAQAAVMVGLTQLLVVDIGLSGFFIAQAVSGMVAALLWLFFLGRQMQRPSFRSWMVPLTLATAALYLVLAVDIRIAETVMERIVAGLVLLPVFCLVVIRTAMSAAERAALSAWLRQKLANWRARMGKAGGA